MALNPQQIIVELTQLAANRPVCIAYSGGVDSHVLLHILATNSNPQLPKLRAIHVDHGLDNDSDKWAKHCAEVAAAYDIEFEAIKVNVENIEEFGLEAAARRARYQAFHFALAEDEVLLTAQHQQDQAETILLQLLRGAGPTGLAAMRTETDLDGLSIIRPLLSESKIDILDYAELHQLDWIEDPSNADSKLNRNFLRHRIFPELEQRWPAVTKTFARSAQHCDEASVLLEDLAKLDAEVVCKNNSEHVLISQLLKLPEARQRNLLRYKIGQAGLTLPSTVVLQRIIDELCNSAEDKTPLVAWPGAEVRRYRDEIFILSANENKLDLGEYRIQGTTTVRLSDGYALKWQLTSGQGLKQHVLNAPLLMKFRQGGERIQLQGQAQHKSLKQLFQEWGVPPWKRQQIPLIFVDHELIAVIGYGYAEHYAADIGEKGWLPSVEPLQ